MTTIIALPKPFTVVSGNANVLTPVSNLNLDTPSLVWTSNNLSTGFIVLDLGDATHSYDTIALIGHNLRASDTVRVRTGTTNTGLGGYAGTAQPSFIGTLSEGSSANFVLKLDALRTERYIRIDVVATGLPSGMISAQRLVIGKAITMNTGSGINMNIEQTFVDRSTALSGDGWEAFIARPALHQIKCSITSANASGWLWIFGFFQQVGRARAFLFVPQSFDTSTWQQEIIFGRLASDPVATMTSYQMRRIEVVVRSLAV